jgi:hypothetical protein
VNRRIKRIFHPYTSWEEYHHGMWRIASNLERPGFVRAAAELMMEPARFYDAMMRAVREWPISCEANLTARAVNRRAWLGHAGCCLAVQSPEECTRLGWHTLTTAQQADANAAADRAIAAWEAIHLSIRNQHGGSASWAVAPQTFTSFG